MKNSVKFAFFGAPHLASVFLDDLERLTLVPSLVITTPDRRRGRGMEIAPPPVKRWALQRGIPTLQPEEFDAATVETIRRRGDFDVFIVIYYGKILTKDISEIPKHGTLNIHFSLLPRWRGTSPIRAAIANDDHDVGTTILLLDEKIDHGLIIAQKKIHSWEWPPKATELEETATHESAQLLVDMLPSWIAGEIEARPQNHDLATICPAYEKKDGELDLKDDGYRNLLKIRAFDSTIGTRAMFERRGKRIRVQILDAHLENGKLVIDAVKPESKRAMQYEEFLRSGARPV